MLFGSGQRSQEQFTVEGMTVNPFVASLPENAVSELQFTSTNAGAEFARPVNVNVTFRSGTNQFHGGTQWSIVNPCLNGVNTPFFQYDSSAHGGKPPAPCTTLWYELWNVGGPVWIPHLYDGRNKSFFYYTYHENLDKLGFVNSNLYYTAPSLEMQAGNFSHYNKTITDPTTGQPFPGNVIPPTRINPVTKTWNDLAWAPGAGITYLSPTSFRNNVSTLGYYGGPWIDYTFKFDQNIGRKDTAAFVYRVWSQDGWQNSPWSGNSPRTFNVGTNRIHDFNFNEVHTFSPTIVNELRVAVDRTFGGSTPLFSNPDGSKPSYTALSGNQWLQKLGIQGITTAPSGPGAPIFSVNGWGYGTYGANPGRSYQTVYQLFDNLTYQRGKHGLKFGWYSEDFAYDSASSGPFWGAFTFDGRFTGDSFADYLLGAPGTITKTVPRAWVSARRLELGAYAQDTWSVTPNLTLSLGLRWNTLTNPIDRNNEYYNFDIQKFALVVPNQKSLSLVSPLWPSSTLPVITASQAGLPSSLFNQHHYFMPRFGFAWRPFGGNNTVVRGGYGIYSAITLFQQLQTGGPFQVTSSFPNQLVNGSPQFTFPNPFAGATGGAPPPVNSATHYSTDFRPPVVQNANLTIERSIAGNWGLRASYVFTRATQLTWARDINQPFLSTQPYSQDRRPYPQWQSLISAENGGTSVFHSLQFVLSHRWASGLWLQASYQYRYDRSDIPQDIWSLEESAPSVTYGYNRHYDWARSGLFPANDVVVNWVYEVPFGHGKKFLSNPAKAGFLGRVADAVLGGWSASGTFTRVGALPFDVIYTGHDPGNINMFSGRPDRVPGCDVYAGQNVHGHWYNPQCFAIPQAGTLGNTPRDFLNAPSTWTVNLNPYKDFPLRIINEQSKIRIGANIYNLFNHPPYNAPSGGVWGVPSDDITSPQAGTITSTRCVRAPADWACTTGVRQIMVRVGIEF
jgi:hypothetical protein